MPPRSCPGDAPRNEVPAEVTGRWTGECPRKAGPRRSRGPPRRTPPRRPPAAGGSARQPAPGARDEACCLVPCRPGRLVLGWLPTLLWEQAWGRNGLAVNRLFTI